MAKKKPITIGQKFGKLTVEAPGPTIIRNNGEPYKTWICRCDCGASKTAKTAYLNSGKIKSCSSKCWHSTNPGNNYKPGQQFGRLMLISFLNGKWKCQCNCINQTIIEVKTQSLTTGNTQSCGCLNMEKRKERIGLAIEARRKFTPEIAEARRVWKNCYFYIDRKNGFTDDQIIDFDNFYKLSQMNCAYCGIQPSKTINHFKYEAAKGSNFAKENGNFTYNGLDRIDNGKNHCFDNLVPCCWLCNRAKNTKTVEEFKIYIKNLRINTDTSYSIITRELPIYYRCSVGSIFKNYKDGDLTKEEFECLSQYDCHYCGNKPTNRHNEVDIHKLLSIKNYDLYEFKYNGLDRLNSSMGHMKNNVVPCCKWCNFAKMNISFNDFNDWIRRIKKFQGFEINDEKE